ncbi:MAG: glycosyltransferase family 4 protein [Alphaproteobacteria bacterium]
MRILLVSDAWLPQVNGVVRTYATVIPLLEAEGHVVRVLGPGHYRGIACPTYGEIRLAFPTAGRFVADIEGFAPDAIHIATEGPLGWRARRYCLTRGIPFTTAFHTRFPEYVQARTGMPVALGYRLLRRFHAPAETTLVATAGLKAELETRGFDRLAVWSRGVDTELFRPRAERILPGPGPIALYVGRVAVEKNVEAFLQLDLPGTKYVVGAGPQLGELRARYPQVRFAGRRQGEDLAAHFAAADVFVFPSRTDTFGLVLLEALASGLPVAAYPVRGPLDVVGDAPVGALDEDLGAAVRRALALDRRACRAHALGFSWQTCARTLLAHVSQFDSEQRAA